MSTLKEIKRIQKLAAGEATMEDIDAQNAKPIQHTTNAQRNAAQPSKLQQLIDAVASKRGISTGVGAGVGGATGYSIGAAAGMSPKAKMLAGILGAAAGGTAGNLFAKQSNVKKAAEDGTTTYPDSTWGRDIKYKQLSIQQELLRRLLQNSAIKAVGGTAGGAIVGGGLGSGAGYGAAHMLNARPAVKVLATILGGGLGAGAGYALGGAGAGLSIKNDLDRTGTKLKQL